MKKIIVFFSLLFSSILSQAQVMNGGFEQFNGAGKISNWGKQYLSVIIIDSSGHSHGDSIVIDRDFYFASTDAHSGAWCLEMRNAYNYTANEGIPGAAILTADSSGYPAFGIELLPIQQRPKDLSFYYKFLPIGNDTAMASLVVYDSTGTELGKAERLISAAATVYTAVSEPVIYTSLETPAFISLYFSTSLPGGHPSFGTRFLVDDVGMQSLGIRSTSIRPLQCYPTLASDELYLALPANTSELAGTWQILTMDGRIVQSGKSASPNSGTVKLQIGGLNSGIYLISLLKRDGSQYIGKFQRQ